LPSTYRDERTSTAARVQRLEAENARLRAGAFSALDWIGVAVTVLGISWLAYFTLRVRTAFLQMFADFGTLAELPAVTRLASSPYFAPAIALAPATLLVASVVGRRGLRVRRAFVVAAFLLVVAEIGFCLWAMYAPIFQVANAIKAD
jgi:hypothetical protein